MEEANVATDTKADASVDSGLLESFGVDPSVLDQGTSPAGVNQSEEAAEETPEELSATEIAEKMANEATPEEGSETPTEDQPSGTESLIGQVNSLEFVHNGAKFQVDSEDQLKDLVQKGFDYTWKTQEIAKETKEAYEKYQQEIETLEQDKQQHTELLDQSEQFDFALAEMERMEPELFEQVKEFVSGVGSQHNNPYVKKLSDQVKTLSKNLEQKTETVENEGITATWDRDHESVMSKIEPVLKKLNITPKTDKWKEYWAKNEGSSVEDAFYATHGKDIQRLYASKSKVSETKKKASNARKPATAGNAKGSQGGSPTEFKGGSYENLAFELAKSMG